MRSVLSAVALVITCAMAAAQPTLKLNHVALYVSDLQKSTEFYENVMHLQRMDEPFHDGKHTWFTLGPAGHLHLIEGEGTDGPHHKNDHLCFSVDDMDTFLSGLRANSITFTDWSGIVNKVQVRVDGIRQIYFKDPDGHLIEVNNDPSVK